MIDARAIMLFSVAPDVADMFRSDPKVADLLDPAVYISADEEGVLASVVERLQLTELISGQNQAGPNPIWDEAPEGAPIAVLVKDENGATVYSVPDPRTAPDLWPWMGIEDEEDELRRLPSCRPRERTWTRRSSAGDNLCCCGDEADVTGNSARESVNSVASIQLRHVIHGTSAAWRLAKRERFSGW